MKTAVEWLQAEFNKWSEGRVFIPQDILEQAKQMEKDQIVNAFEVGYKSCDIDEALEINKTMFNGEKYYIDNYKPETI
jgi:hypothetical protein